jgi:glycosyltransferase involved in cell wall biosynthesis
MISINKKQSLVFIIVTDYLTANIFSYYQITELKNIGYRIYLICGAGKLTEELNIYCEKVYQIKNLKRNISILNDSVAFIMVSYLIFRYKPKIIIYSTPKAALISSLSGKILRVPIRIYQIWGARWQTLIGYKYILVKLLDKISIMNSSNLLGVSKSIADLYSTITNKPIIVLGKGSAIGLNCVEFNYKHEVTRGKNYLIGYAGRLADDKGIKELIKYFMSVRKFIPDIYLEIIGDLDYSDPIDNNIVQIIKTDLQINWIRGFDRKNLANRMREWTVQVFPSKREGLGNSIIEAQACGVPTLCWNIVGASDAVPEFLSDCLIPTFREDIFISRIVHYLRNPLNLNKKIALMQWTHQNFCREKVLRNFSNYVLKLEKSEIRD